MCGKSGCFECHASADGLLRHFRRTLSSRNIDSSLSKYALLSNAFTFMTYLREHPEDDVLKDSFQSFRADLVTGLANLVTFYNPDIICIGGGISQAPEIFHGIDAAVDAETLPATRGRVRILPAKLRTDAGAVGAALLGFLSVIKE